MWKKWFDTGDSDKDINHMIIAFILILAIFFVYICFEIESEKKETEQERLKEYNEMLQQQQDGKAKGPTVYVSRNGIYHKDADCCGMQIYMAMTSSEARQSGNRACKICYGY